MIKKTLIKSYLLSAKNHLKVNAKDLALISIILAFLLSYLHRYILSHASIPSIGKDGLGCSGILIISDCLRRVLFWDDAFLFYSLSEKRFNSILFLKRLIWLVTSLLLAIAFVSWFSLHFTTVAGFAVCYGILRLTLIKLWHKLPTPNRDEQASFWPGEVPKKWNPVVRSFVLLHLALLGRKNRWGIGLAIFFIILVILFGIELQKQFQVAAGLYLALVIPLISGFKDLTEDFPESAFYQATARTWKVHYLRVRILYNLILALPFLFIYLVTAMLRLPDFNIFLALLSLPLAGLVVALSTSLSTYLRLIAPSSQIIRIILFSILGSFPPLFLILYWRERSLKNHA